MNFIDCKSKLMGAEDSDARSPGRQSKQEDPEAFPRGRESSDTGSLGRQSKCWTQEDRDGLPRKLQQEDHDGLPRKLAQEDHDGWPRIGTRRS